MLQLRCRKHLASQRGLNDVCAKSHRLHLFKKKFKCSCVGKSACQKKPRRFQIEAWRPSIHCIICIPSGCIWHCLVFYDKQKRLIFLSESSTKRVRGERKLVSFCFQNPNRWNIFLVSLRQKTEIGTQKSILICVKKQITRSSCKFTITIFRDLPCSVFITHQNI